LAAPVPGPLTAFTNALAVSLFSLVPGHKVGPATAAAAVGGLAFVAAALLSLFRLCQGRRRDTLRHAVLLVGLAVTFVIQLIEGAAVITDGGDSGAVNTIAVLVIVCFLIGIARAWKLIGGPSIGIAREMTALVRSHRRSGDDSVDEESP
jgi:hypothetical protein